MNVQTSQYTDSSIPLFTAAAMSASANGATVLVARAASFSGVLSWTNTGTPVGTFRLQVSLDGSTWYDRTDGDGGFTSVVDGSTTTSASFNFVDLGWRYVRVRFIRTSGGTSNTSLAGFGFVK